MDESGRLWAVTCYFNPAGYATKQANYRVFRRMLRVPLVAVELSFGERFELGPGDAEILVQLRDGDVMWQKERLLNIAVTRLPRECDFVAWLDCDILFDRSDWPREAVRELARVPVCQLYRRVYHLAPGVAAADPGSCVVSYESIAYAFVKGLPVSAGSLGEAQPNIYTWGHAWCARREFVEQYGLYDRCILGGGDRALAQGIIGQAEELIARNWMGPGFGDDYRGWVSAVRQQVTAMTYIEGDIHHLWHGDLERRQYRMRWRILADHGYDPATDLALSAEGCWKWNSPKSGMHRAIRDYFGSRREDGELEESPAR